MKKNERNVLKELNYCQRQNLNWGEGENQSKASGHQYRIPNLNRNKYLECDDSSTFRRVKMPPEQKLRSLKHLQNKFLNYFNARNFNNVIEQFSELKMNVNNLEQQICHLNDDYQKKIAFLNGQRDSDQHKINTLESTIKSLHKENDNTIFILESLQNENVQLYGRNIFQMVQKQQPVQYQQQISQRNNYDSTFNTQFDFSKQNQILIHESKRFKAENQNLLNETQLLRNQVESLKNQCQNLENENALNKNEVINNNKMILFLKDQNEKLITSKNDSNNKDQKLKEQIQILKLQNNTLEAENEALTISLSHHSMYKRAIKELQKKNFNLEIEIEKLKMKHFSSPFKEDKRVTFPDQKNETNLKKKSDIGIFTDENIGVDDITDYKKFYLDEKERRKSLAVLLSKIIIMMNSKCDRFKSDCETLLNSQNVRITNVQTAINNIVNCK